MYRNSVSTSKGILRICIKKDNQLLFRAAFLEFLFAGNPKMIVHIPRKPSLLKKM
jgi:hypothetical protein